MLFILNQHYQYEHSQIAILRLPIMATNSIQVCVHPTRPCPLQIVGWDGLTVVVMADGGGCWGWKNTMGFHSLPPLSSALLL